jgi:hypothetical protein
VPRWRPIEDAPELAALVGVRDALLAFTSAFTADETAILWFSPSLRRVYAVPDPCIELRRLSSLDLVPAGRSCSAWVRDEAAAALGGAAPGVTGADVRVGASGEPPQGAPARRMVRAPATAEVCEAHGTPGHVHVDRPKETGDDSNFLAALAHLEAYTETGSLHRLRAVLADPTLRLQAGLGRATGRGFMSLCEAAAERRCALVWLGPALPGRTAVESKIRAVGPALWRRTRTLLVGTESHS